MRGHYLKIRSLYDAQAECTCGGWHMACTGECTAEDIRKEYEKHLKRRPGCGSISNG